MLLAVLFMQASRAFAASMRQLGAAAAVVLPGYDRLYPRLGLGMITGNMSGSPLCMDTDDTQR
jgi:hypothetical protein